MEALSRSIIKLNAVPDPELHFPTFVVTPDTSTLENVDSWIHLWDEAYLEFKSGKVKDYENRKVAQKELALSRLIKSPHKSAKSYGPQIAEWAAAAGNFPTTVVKTPFSVLPIPLSEYWKQLIVRCARDESIYLLHEGDMSELLEHCETNIPLGTSHSHLLFQCLREASKKLASFLGVESRSTPGKFTILSGETSAELVNIKAMIAAAPEQEPKEIQFKSKADFLRAKFRWDMKLRHGQNLGGPNES
jgi:hypothetical protein